MSDARPLLETRALSVGRGGVGLLDGVDLRIMPGSALVLRGPNGSGKTSLLRTLAGLQPPRDGTLEAEPDDIVLAGHLDGVKPTLSVAENLRFWAEIFGTSGIEQALRTFDLDRLRDRMAASLSAGQKRRLGLARLIVAGRKLWLLDEPTVSLDQEATGLFASAVRAHLDQGGAAIIATHIDLGLAPVEHMDVSQYCAAPPAPDDFDEAFG
ncbi:heme ABC exporter ATP-binding protein CcmA [Roseovarius nubinhibens]|uniref:Heme ABC exporter ATP-binding protein CcmA n=1 Tax=Roseovarius nubinhibens TaxID=314263 RepID=A0A348WDZ5_9RHOB|nr:heme ABC exporter ATP-binding protein CcmA [Roseovarius nubinhibens]